MTHKTAHILAVFSLLVELLDIVLKYSALKWLPEEGGYFGSIIGITLHKNPGIAFDTPVPLSLVIFLTVIVTALLIKYSYKQYKLAPERTAAALMIVIGALGNMFDRLINSFTTDYLLLFTSSVINLSDILIITGTILLLLYTRDKNTT